MPKTQYEKDYYNFAKTIKGGGKPEIRAFQVEGFMYFMLKKEGEGSVSKSQITEFLMEIEGANKGEKGSYYTLTQRAIDYLIKAENVRKTPQSKLKYELTDQGYQDAERMIIFYNQSKNPYFLNNFRDQKTWGTILKDPNVDAWALTFFIREPALKSLLTDLGNGDIKISKTKSIKPQAFYYDMMQLMKQSLIRLMLNPSEQIEEEMKSALMKKNFGDFMTMGIKLMEGFPEDEIITNKRTILSLIKELINEFDNTKNN